MSSTKPYINPFQQDETATIEETDKGCRIVVWNDDVNTFEWVILTLMEVCGHSAEQAEQCAMIIHSNGKYAVKEGTFEKLRPMCEAIIDRGIDATIEDTE